MIDASRNELHLKMAEHARAICERNADDVSACGDELVNAAVDYVPGAQHAGITLIRNRGQLQTAAASGTYPAMLDEVQKRHGQGPCLDAARRRRAVQVDDLTCDTRWPLYRREALAKTPVRSVLSLALLPDQYTAGALNLFAEQPKAFSADAVAIAQIFATHAALAFGTVRAKNQLRRAVSSRDVIGQAKGILMERYNITSEDAFTLLRRLSEESQISVADVSRRLVARRVADNSGEDLVGELLLKAASKVALRGQRGERHRQMIRDATRC